MAVKRIGKTTSYSIAEYIGLNADLVNGKPDITDCDPGSTFYVCDTKASFIWDGTTWWPL